MACMYEQLLSEGYCIVDCDEEYNVLRDTATIISDWFQLPLQQKRDAAASSKGMAAGTGRGYFTVPAKEVVEISNAWKGANVGVELRLAARTTYTKLQHAAMEALDRVLKLATSFKVTPQQLKHILGQEQPFPVQSHNSSILHINQYRPAAAVPAYGRYGLQGCEAHVDKGLLTVIYATGPGLQVISRDGCWLPVNPGPNQLVILVGHTLSYLTAGMLPATMHRVVVPPTAAAAAAAAGPAAAAAAGAGASTGSGTSSRLSLCFKLHAAPDALLAPTEITGTAADRLPVRYRVPKTTKQLIAEFDAVHTSIHNLGASEAEQQQQQQQQPAEQLQTQQAGQQQQQQLVLPTVAAPAKRHHRDNSPDQAQKRQCLQSITNTEPSAGPKQPQESKTLIVTFRSMFGDEMQFKLNRYLPTGPAMEKWLEKYPAEEQGWRFMFDGDRLDPTASPLMLKMEDGDVVDVVVPQMGD